MLLVSSTGTAVTVEPGTGADRILHAWRLSRYQAVPQLTGTEQNARPTGPEQEPQAIEPEAARMIPTATSRIEGIAILQHHDLVTGEAIVGPNLLEQRHRAPRRSARSTASSRTTSSAPSRPRLPALNRTPLGSEAARNRIPASRGAPSGAPSTPASARTGARIHRNPGHLPEYSDFKGCQYAPSAMPPNACAPSGPRAEHNVQPAPSPPRPATGTPSGIPPRRPSPDRRRVWRSREPASTRRAQRPREPTRYAPSEAARRKRRQAASEGRPGTGWRGAT